MKVLVTIWVAAGLLKESTPSFFFSIVPAKTLGLTFMGLVDLGHMPIPEPIIVTGGVEYLIGQAWATCPFLELSSLSHF